MAVRQYVGARYVPQIMGDWNDQTVYEPLSIVHYNFASYTSKKAVPAGVEPTNEEYWALTSQDSQQVEAYRQEVEGLKETVDGIISGNKSSTRTFDFQNEGFLFVIDSYGETRVDITIPLLTIIKNNLGIPDANFFSIIKGGLGFNQQYPENAFSLTKQFATNNPTQWETVTNVVYILGTNDIALPNFNTFKEGISKTAAFLKAQGKRMAVMCDAFSMKPEHIPNLNRVKLGYAEACAINGVYCYNNCSKVLYSAGFITTDLVHPYQTGITALANFISNVLLGDVPYTTGENIIRVTAEEATVSGNLNNYTGDIKSLLGMLTITGATPLTGASKQIVLHYVSQLPECSQYSGNCLGTLTIDGTSYTQCSNVSFTENFGTIFFRLPATGTEWKYVLTINLPPIKA